MFFSGFERRKRMRVVFACVVSSGIAANLEIFTVTATTRGAL